ncbi:MAG: NUDIX domain-containing protein [Planctomycetes bacterium]|jgi:8-oxo-dGTP diphosphatase|nr:NUDIX domain-containing protein [Planctomycetota bacterium]
MSGDDRGGPNPTERLLDWPELPFRIAVLVYLFDASGRLLMLHRRKPPNVGRFSAIGGKIEVQRGESPHECARRETFEEAGLLLQHDDLRLMGIISERAYLGENHWLIFLFESTHAIDHAAVTRMSFDEGELRWVPEPEVADLPIPDADRIVMWPNVQRHRGGFFMAEIDCSVQPAVHRVVESAPPTAR